MRKYLFLLLVPIGFGFRDFLLSTPDISDEKLAMVIMAFTFFVISLPILSFVQAGEDVPLIEESTVNKDNLVCTLNETVEDDVNQKGLSHSDTFNFSTYYIEPLLALVLFISFFLPWIDMIFLNISGYQIVQDIGTDIPRSLLWLIPIFPIVLILTSFFRVNLRFISLLTGLTPFLLLVWSLLEQGKLPPMNELQQLTFGVYLTAITSFILIVLGMRQVMKKDQITSLEIPFYAMNIFLAVGICISFFLPWIYLTIIPYSGYALVVDEMVSKPFLILIPLAAIITIIEIGLKKYVFFPMLTGFLPFIFLMIYASENSNNIFKMLTYGGYLTLFLSILLIVVTVAHTRTVKRENKIT